MTQPKTTLWLAIMVLISLSVSQKASALSPNSKAFTLEQLDIQPTFGGRPAVEFEEWFKQRIVIPKSVMRNDTTIYISFEISTYGYIDNIVIKGTSDENFKKEISYLLKNSGDWRPGAKGTKMVPTVMSLSLKIKNIIKEQITFGVREKLTPQTEIDSSLRFTETNPTFMGGDIEKFRIWVIDRVRFPDYALESKLRGGMVMVSFFVEKDGNVANIRTWASPHLCYTDEVIRVIDTSPKWSPGMVGGVAVRVRYTLQINFNY